jgi:predicted acylesterase/phospholipase RssA
MVRLQLRATCAVVNPPLRADEVTTVVISRQRTLVAAALTATCLCALGLGTAGASDQQPAETSATSAEAEPEPAVEDIADAGPAPSEQPAEVEQAKLPIPLAVTVSGGVSLGSYQAGYLYYLTETVKANRELFEVKMLTGASAGLINGLIALIEMGSAAEDDPRETLFYSMWTEFTWDQLLDVGEAPQFALSSRKILHQLGERAEKRWRDGLAEDIDVVLGATATRMKSVQTELSEGLTIPRQEEKFVFRVTGRGPGREPLVTNYADPTHVLEQPVLPFRDPDEQRSGADRKNFDLLLDILFASSSLPLVFEPQRVEFCTTKAGGVAPDEAAEQLACEQVEHVGRFADGAVFDKWPLRLAYRTARAGLIDDGRGGLTWREIPDLDRVQTPDERLFFLYIDPEDSAYPPLPPPTETRPRDGDDEVGLFQQLGLFFGGYIISTQAKELYTLIEEHPDVRDRIKLAAHELPSASGLLANFFGFFDRKFRVYDFYQGMRDARIFVESQLQSRARALSGDDSIEVVLPEPASMSADDDSWKPYFCLRAQLDGEQQYSDACRGDDLQDFRILLQVSLDRLYDHCRRLSSEEPISHRLCREARDGGLPPRVAGVNGTEHEDNLVKQDTETEFAYVMRLLESYEFHFEDLGLDRDEARRAMSMIREDLLHLADEFGKKLPWGERQTVRVLGKPAVNFFKYAAPRAIIYFTAGKGAELGASLTGRWIPSRWFRLNTGLQMQGLVQLVSELENVFTLTPLAGFELEIPALNGPMIQLRGGLRIGYQLSTTDGFHSRECDGERFAGDSVRCSAPVFQGFLAISFYERIRVQLGLEWFPEWLPPMDQTGQHVWNGLIEVGWQWISPF